MHVDLVPASYSKLKVCALLKRSAQTHQLGAFFATKNNQTFFDPKLAWARQSRPRYALELKVCTFLKGPIPTTGLAHFWLPTTIWTVLDPQRACAHQPRPRYALKLKVCTFWKGPPKNRCDAAFGATKKQLNYDGPKMGLCKSISAQICKEIWKCTVLLTLRSSCTAIVAFGSREKVRTLCDRQWNSKAGGLVAAGPQGIPGDRGPRRRLQSTKPTIP